MVNDFPQIPGYRIQRELGHGGMATVYLAVQGSLEREVAIKVMATALAADRSFSERFLKEARTAARLQHPGIVAIYDTGVVGHHHYIAMELVAGGELKDRLRGGALAPEQAVRLTTQIAEALAYAHDKGFVHRDVKPENILFRENGHAVLTDFGIARSMGSGTRMTGTGMSIGTPHYMSPEQARGRDVDGRSDLYALGVLFYEMLTGKVPFDAQDSFAVGLMHINEAPPELPDHLARYQPVLDRLLAKEPEARFQTGQALIDELSEFETSTASSPSRRAATRVLEAAKQGTCRKIDKKLPYRRSRSGLFWGLGGAALAGVLGVSLYLWQAQAPSSLPVGGPSSPSEDPVTQLSADLVELAHSLERNPDNSEGWAELGMAYKNIRDFSSAEHALRRSLSIDDSSTFVAVELAETLMFMGNRNGLPDESRELLTQALIDEPNNQKAMWLLGIGAYQAGDFERAIVWWERLLPLLDPDSSVYNSVAGQVAQARVELAQDPDPSLRPAPQPGETFRDCPDCPEMVVIPAGRFTMGSPSNEPRRYSGEGPPRTVNVPSFALGTKEVTFAEWDACVVDGGCSHRPDDENWGRGNRPVINVSWNDAQEYVRWLSRKTGESYRLPSESEWEYAARAGTTTRFHTGNCITTDQANFFGNNPAWGCPRGESRQRTVPVGSFAPNAFGLHDMHGNVWEWVQDCWNRSYNGAPSDGSAWMSGDCDRAVLRGGSWLDAGHLFSSANRGDHTRGYPGDTYGFRVARSVTL